MKTMLSILFVLSLAACSTPEKGDSSTPQGAFQMGQELEKEERFEEAIQKYADVKNKHPYSKFAVESELKIADLQYQREAFIEAQNAYQLFKDFHPKHPKTDYVTYRLGMSYFMQLPTTIDRDLSLADKAIVHFSEVVNSYPNSTYAKEAGDKRAEVLRKLSEKELYIANFYFKRKQYDSALARYETILRNYPTSADVPYALYGAAYSAHQMQKPESVERYVTELKERFPDSDETKRAQKELKSHDK